MMNKKRGILIVGLLFLLFSALSVMAQEDVVREDVIIGMIVVAILLIIIIILLISVIKKKFLKLVKQKPAETKGVHEEEIHARVEELGKEAKPQPVKKEATEKIKEKKQKPKFEEESEISGPQQAKPSGFLAKAKRLKEQAEAPAQEQQQDVKIGGFQKEEFEKSAEDITESGGYKMKKCSGCGFDLLADEKECPVCGKKM